MFATAELLEGQNDLARRASPSTAHPRVLAFVLAGGEGTRLHALTAHRCKPAVPFNGKHRIVDFVLSNLIKSEIYSVYLLVQYKSQALIEHVRESWQLARFIPGHFVTVVPPQMHHGPEWFQGTADAIFQNLHLIETQQPDYVAVFGADHIYRMDVRQMLEVHREKRADVTIAALPVPVDQSASFGIVEADESMRIVDFQEKPPSARSLPDRPGFTMASMGNYIFSRDVLVAELRRAHELGESDFGKHLLPRMIPSRRLFAYDFSTNVLPGLADHEERAYWRDVGTIDAYFDAHMDTLSARPRFRMTNSQWPIYASPDQAESAQIESGVIRRSVVGSGCIVESAILDHTMLRRSVIVETDASLDHCIVMERSVVGTGAKLRRVIVDQDNRIPPGERIGFDLEQDRRRFHVSDGGVAVVPRAHYA